MGPYCYDYPRPAVTVDIVVFQWREGGIRILLIQRAQDPFAGQWALPGGFVEMEETCAEAAARELEEETGLSSLGFQEVSVFAAPHRDPRGRTISVAHLAIVPRGQSAPVRGGDDAARAEWFDVRSLPALAFDHEEIVASAMTQLRRGALYLLEGLKFLPEPFTPADLQAVHEAVLGRRVVRERLRARLEEWGVLDGAGLRAGPNGGQEVVYQVNWQRLEQLREEDSLAVLGDVRIEITLKQV